MIDSPLFHVGRILYDIPDLSMTLIKSCIIALSIVLFRGVPKWFLSIIFMPFSDPLRHLPGPPGSLFQNHFREVLDPGMTPTTHTEWVKNYGKTFKFHGFGKHDYRLMSFDFRVISHVLNSSVFEKPWQTKTYVNKLIGKGLFSTEGVEHKAHRKALFPCFSSQSAKTWTPNFTRKAEELCEQWKTLMHNDQKHTSSDDISVVIDVAHWTSRASFDVMGLTTFDYDFNAVQDDSREVYTAYRRIFNIIEKGFGLKGLLELYFPVLSRLWMTDEIKLKAECRNTINRAGMTMIAEKRIENQLAWLSDNSSNQSRDALSVLLKSNLSNSTSIKLSDEEILDECSSLLFTGTDTISVALTWCLHLLSLHPTVQTRLRDELRDAMACHNADGNSSDSSADSGFHDCTSSACACRCNKTLWDKIEGLPYLEAVIRETLRLCPPVHGIIRVAMADTHVPVSRPITLSTGEIIHKDECLEICKGSYVHIPIEGLNYSEDLWGPDALDFNPDRWKDLQGRPPSIPGIGNLMTFGYGPQSCLGYKFSMAETKVFITILLLNFAFSPLDIKITKYNSILTRPFLSGKWAQGTQLPLHVRQLRTEK